MDDQNQRKTFFPIIIELFFALLPLFVFWAVWSEETNSSPQKSFFLTPEWSMTACVLYGLTLARLQMGAVAIAKQKFHKGDGAGIVVLSLAPLTGVIFSIILITKLSSGDDSNFLLYIQILNFLVSVVFFCILGSYGINRSILSEKAEKS